MSELNLTGELVIVLASFWIATKIVDYWSTSEESNANRI